jgi:hypothetical protein
MSMDEHTRACLQAIVDGKPMQRMLASEWHDCTMGEALEWLGKDFMRGHIRIKPQVMCELAGVQYPMPMTEVLNYGDDYYVASPQGVDQHTWRNDCLDVEWLALHICHATKEAAQAHSRALHAVNAQAVKAAKERA